MAPNPNPDYQPQILSTILPLPYSLSYYTHTKILRNDINNARIILAFMVSDISKIEVYDETRLKALEKKLGISVKSRELLKSAITSPKARENNPLDELEDLDRLAFIGDSILYFVASEHVLRKFNDVNEKKILHDEREKYKQDKNLAQILLKNQLLEYFWIEENYLCGSINWTELMGTFFEAIIGAIYLDQCKLDSAMCFVQDYIISNIDRIIE